MFPSSRIYATHMLYLYIQRKLKKERQQSELQQSSYTLQALADSFVGLASEFVDSANCSKTVIGRFGGTEGDGGGDDEESNIGKPAFLEVSSVTSNDSINFGGGYEAPLEHVQVKVLYNA